MNVSLDMVESLSYKLQMFGIPIDVYSNMLCANKAIYRNTITPESVLKNKHHYISNHRYREAVADKTIRVANQGTENNISDIFTKIITALRRRLLLEKFTY